MSGNFGVLIPDAASELNIDRGSVVHACQACVGVFEGAVADLRGCKVTSSASSHGVVAQGLSSRVRACQCAFEQDAESGVRACQCAFEQNAESGVRACQCAFEQNAESGALASHGAHADLVDCESRDNKVCGIAVRQADSRMALSNCRSTADASGLSAVDSGALDVDVASIFASKECGVKVQAASVGLKEVIDRECGRYSVYVAHQGGLHDRCLLCCSSVSSSCRTQDLPDGRLCAHAWSLQVAVAFCITK
jgi:hypothetical protein